MPKWLVYIEGEICDELPHGIEYTWVEAETEDKAFKLLVDSKGGREDFDSLNVLTTVVEEKDFIKAYDDLLSGRVLKAHKKKRPILASKAEQALQEALDATDWNEYWRNVERRMRWEGRCRCKDCEQIRKNGGTADGISNADNPNKESRKGFKGKGPDMEKIAKEVEQDMKRKGEWNLNE